VTPHELVGAHTVYACVVGSRAYGLSGCDSDTDRRGVYAAPTPLFWGLDQPPTHVDGPAPEQFSWELARCCELALAANPTVLECLWSPLVEHVDATGRELLAIRGAFLSGRLAQTYGGYARDQFHRLDAARRRTGEIRWKQAMHMVRLLMAGAHVLRTGEILVDVTAHRDRLLAVRAGEVSWDGVQAWADDLHTELARAAEQSVLPVEPDRAVVSDFLVRTRRATACGDRP
jgi:predicted nucleotidyltransferase